MTESQRNLAILGVVAVAGAILSGQFNVAAGSVFALLNVAFAVLIVWWLVGSYQRNSGTIAQMPVGPRLVLQLSGAALILIYVTGTLGFSFLPHPPFGWQVDHVGLFYGALLLCGFGLWWSWQQRTSRW